MNYLRVVASEFLSKRLGQMVNGADVHELSDMLETAWGEGHNVGFEKGSEESRLLVICLQDHLESVKEKTQSLMNRFKH